MPEQPDTLAATRLLVADALAFADFDAAEEPPPGEPRVVDTPVTSVRDVGTGLWQIEAGTATDVEVDEVFLVLAGWGSLAFEDGSTVELRPGVLVRLHEGDRTTWVIEEPLRKLYLAWPQSDGG